MMRPSTLCWIALLGTLLAACTTTYPYVAGEHRGWRDVALPPASERTYQVFLLGDAGAAAPDSAVLGLLRRRLAEADANSAVVFLGDNVYPGGLPDSAAAERAASERSLSALIDVLQTYKGRVVFIPGERDWHQGALDGLEAVNRQEAFIEDRLDKNVFRPDDGFPGPDEIKLTDDLRLVVLDTQWWLHPYDKAHGDAGDYDIDEDADFFLQLDDLIKKNDDRHLLVVGHHALFTNGRHGGFFSWHDHLFPLTHLIPGAYLPLPLVGSIYPLYARFIGGRQNLVHARYQSLRAGLLERFRGHENLIYASGHDRSLQYFPRGNQHYLVSGAASQREPVARGHDAGFAAGQRGFMTLHYYRDGSVWLEAWGLDPNGTTASGRPLFRTELAGPASDRIDPGVPATATALPDYTDSTRSVVANPDLAAGGLKRFFWGSNRRDAWTTPVEVPYLDLGREAGGLTVLQRGGGLQSTSLRLQGADGHEYVLRSARKDPARSLPPDLRRTFAAAISNDLGASQHPYGAYIIPPLADAVGIYHTNPRPVYVPDDPRLGIYRDLVAGELMLFEERPSDDMSDAPHFGNSEDVDGAATMYREVTNDNDHQVDQRALARARLFDMLLSDWDRHIDQWRWATFEVEDETGEQTIYRPIPRDRDVAFNRLNGLFPGLAKPFTKYQDFRATYGNLYGLTLNAWEQDHRFLSALERSDWVEIADSMQAALTDAVIEEAVQTWPEPLYALNGQEIIDILKARRDQLPEVAAAFYTLHARSVHVVGSNKHERFEVHRLPDGETEVTVYKTKKDGDLVRPFYRRTFYPAETKEVFLYGFDGDDHFEITGEANRGILLIGVGGPGEDTFSDASHVRGWSKKTRFYDTVAGNDWAPGPETRIIRSDDPSIHHYDYEIRYDTLAPTPIFGGDRDDGTLLGLGFRYVRHHLRKRPYSNAHQLRVSYALGTRALQAAYAGHWVAEVNPWDLVLDAYWKNEDNTHNFFGFGNETAYDDDLDEAFHQARLSQIGVAPALLWESAAGLTLRLGGHLEVTDAAQDTTRFIGQQPTAVIAPRTFDAQWYGGLDATLTLGDLRHAPANPRQGLRWMNTAALNIGLRDAAGTFGTLRSELTVYTSPSFYPQVTFAARAGLAHTVGDFPFFYANTLGGRSNLRGYRNERFAGRTSLFQNVELRLGLAQYASYLALGELGLLGFFDNGRVWYDGEASRTWHQGYGGGLWVSVFNTFVLTGTVGFSEEGTFFKVETGFLF